jgi:molybdopterin synthase catalytic subunit
MNHVKVMLFATLRDYVGSRTVELDLPAKATIGDLERVLVAKYPGLERVRGSMMAAINRSYAADDQVIPEDAEIAFFPPVSGG